MAKKRHHGVNIENSIIAHMARRSINAWHGMRIIGNAGVWRSVNVTYKRKKAATASAISSMWHQQQYQAAASGISR